jgi:hypothetical protein
MSKIETAIARRLVANALADKLTVSVYDGGAWCLKRSTNLTEIMDALQSTDCDTLRFRNADGVSIGSVLLIWGNEDDLISDHTDNDAIAALVRRTV